MSDQAPAEPDAQTSMREANLSKDVKIAFVAVIVAVFAATFYIVNFIARPLGSPSDWAAFGDYFGGLVNPAVGIVTALLVVRTLKTTRDEADETRRQLGAQISQMQREQELNELQKRLDGVLGEWIRLMDQPVHGLLRTDDFGENLREAPSGWTVGGALSSVEIQTEALMIVRADKHLIAANIKWHRQFGPAAELLRELSVYCGDYQAAAKNPFLADFYRRRVSRMKGTLAAMELVPPSVLDGLRVVADGED